MGEKREGVQSGGNGLAEDTARLQKTTTGREKDKQSLPDKHKTSRKSSGGGARFKRLTFTTLNQNIRVNIPHFI